VGRGKRFFGFGVRGVFVFSGRSEFGGAGARFPVVKGVRGQQRKLPPIPKTEGGAFRSSQTGADRGVENRGEISMAFVV